MATREHRLRHTVADLMSESVLATRVIEDRVRACLGQLASFSTAATLLFGLLAASVWVQGLSPRERGAGFAFHCVSLAVWALYLLQLSRASGTIARLGTGVGKSAHFRLDVLNDKLRWLGCGEPADNPSTSSVSLMIGVEGRLRSLDRLRTKIVHAVEDVSEWQGGVLRYMTLALCAHLILGACDGLDGRYAVPSLDALFGCLSLVPLPCLLIHGPAGPPWPSDATESCVDLLGLHESMARPPRHRSFCRVLLALFVGTVVWRFERKGLEDLWHSYYLSDALMVNTTVLVGAEVERHGQRLATDPWFL